MNPQMLCEQLSTYNYILEERKEGRKEGMKQQHALTLSLWQTADAISTIQHHKIKHSNLKLDSLAVLQVLPASAHVNDQQ